MQTERLFSDSHGIDHAARLLECGSLVAFATETVYGLGADARNGRAVASIFAAKGRPSFNPLIVHVADIETAKTLTRWNETATRLAAAFWPGPLTLVLPLTEGHGLSGLVTAGLSTVALRMPAHVGAQALLSAFGGPIAAPSANPSGRISPTSARHVFDGLNGRIAAVIDDGTCEVGLESSIVGLGMEPTLLRHGALPQEVIESVLGLPLAAGSGTIVAPGQLDSHYAPDAPLRMNIEKAHRGEVHLGFGPILGDLSLSPSGNLVEAAATLFGCLHKLDATGQPIAVAPIPITGLGRAINDRLRRAATPR